jgi:hypothetical protein
MKAFLPLLVACAFAIKIPLLNTVALSTGSKDALADVLQLLYDLKQLNSKEQGDADIRKVKEDAECSSTLATLAANRDSAEEAWNSAKNHLKFVEDELKTTQDHIADLRKRLDDNKKLIEERENLRCEQSNAFVRKILEHYEALEIIELLRAEIKKYFKTGEKGFLEIAESMMQLVPGTSEILAELSQSNVYLDFGDDLYKVSYDSSQETEHIDNNVDGLKNLDDSAFKNQRPDFEEDTEKKTDKLLDKLKDHINKSLQDLQEQEIKAAYDFANWLKNIKKENDELAAELARKEKYEAKLKVDLIPAKTYEEKTHSDYDNAVAAYNAKKAECEHKEEYYKKETARRQKENLDIDECIKIMETVLPNLESYTRQRADDVSNTPLPKKKIDDYSLDRSKYEAAGGFTA